MELLPNYDAGDLRQARRKSIHEKTGRVQRPAS